MRRPDGPRRWHRARPASADGYRPAACARPSTLETLVSGRRAQQLGRTNEDEQQQHRRGRPARASAAHAHSRGEGR
jgi:hypothetical protein